jgi:hypothetical protein
VRSIASLSAGAISDSARLPSWDVLYRDDDESYKIVDRTKVSRLSARVSQKTNEVLEAFLLAS